MSGDASRRSALAGDWAELARAAARGSTAEEDAGLVCELLILDLAGDAYALPVERVREIVRVRPITPMPGVPEVVLGVISLRGEMLQVLDLRRRLGLETRRPGRATRIVVVNGEEELSAGLLVDGVSQVLCVSEAELMAPAEGTPAVTALCAHDDRFVSLLDLDRVVELDGGD